MRRSKFNLSYHRLLTGDMGWILPVGLTEVLPGDTMRHQSAALLRMAPMAAPIMHPVDIKIHHWFVPHRLVWDDWEDFITGTGELGTFPQVEHGPLSDFSKLFLEHYGVPRDTHSDTRVNRLPIFGYNLIFNEFYRDQDIDTEIADTTIGHQRARWSKDYFTTARTDPQSGDEVIIPMTGVTDVTTNQETPNFTTRPSGTGGTFADQDLRALSTGGSFDTVFGTGSGASDRPVKFGDESGLEVDLNQTGAGILVEQMRRAFALQRFAEARARFGSRYTDYLRYLGIRPSDARLQRPEYLGGGKQTFSFSEVLATAEGTNTDVGEMFGHGIAALRTRPYRRFFEEHGYIHSFMFIRPRPIYMQQMEKMWRRFTKEEFWQKEQEMLGMQELRKYEVYAPDADEDGVFGWQNRYDDYRRQRSYVSGGFTQSTDDFWHLARKFGAAPSLNSSFLQCDPANRVFLDTNMDQFRAMVQHKISARRMVAKTAKVNI